MATAEKTKTETSYEWMVDIITRQFCEFKDLHAAGKMTDKEFSGRQQQFEELKDSLWEWSRTT